MVGVVRPGLIERPRELPAGAVSRAVDVAAGVERAFRESCMATGSSWPFGWCVEASVALRDELLDDIPEVEPSYVWGAFGEPALRLVGHAWVALADGTILDVTAGQFREYLRLACPRLQEVEGLLVVTLTGAARAAYHEERRGTPDGRP